MRVSIELYGPVSDSMRNVDSAIDIEPSPRSLDALRDVLSCALPDGDALKAPHLRIAINDVLIGPDSTLELKDGDRVAILSPFSGG